jgi:hypothetical protein
MQVVGVDVYVADRFGGWQAKVLTKLAELYDPAGNSFPADAAQQASRCLLKVASGCGPKFATVQHIQKAWSCVVLQA